MARTVATVIAALALLASVGFAWWSSHTEPPPPTLPDRTVATAPLPGKHELPYEVFAQTVAGDWRAFKRTTVAPDATFHATAVAKVIAASDQAVTIQVRGRVAETGDEKASPAETYPRKSITLGELAGTDRVGWKVFDVAMTEESRTVGSRAFPCTKITYQHDDPLFPKKVSRVELWISKEVPAGGLVAEHEVQTLDDKRYEMTTELIGFGRGGQVGWGSAAIQ